MNFPVSSTFDLEMKLWSEKQESRADERDSETEREGAIERG